MSERSEQVKAAMERCREENLHLGRPAKFMFEEDIDTAPEGRCNDDTIIVTEEEFYGYARKGYSLYKVANMLGLGYNIIIFEVKPRQPGTRFKGSKDRYSIYMNLYKEAKGKA